MLVVRQGRGVGWELVIQGDGSHFYEFQVQYSLTNIVGRVVAGPRSQEAFASRILK